MNMQGFLILLVPIIGLVPICREKRWNWKVSKSSSLLTVLFWFGWFTSLTVGILVVAGLK